MLPKLSDPRLHLAATITSLQVIGQIGFHFELSIAQILIALATCAVLEIAIALRRQHVLLWPASALLTGNGVAFVLRVPGTVHGEWWSTRGWWIFAGTAAIALLSKYVLVWRGAHIFNPSNIGLVICFLALGRTRAAPLDFWWGPMSPWLVTALAVIVVGGFAILLRLSLLRVALGFWASFAAGLAVVAAAGHAMTARWHLGPVAGFHFWAVLVTSPEVLVFLFFMITDPKTAPRGPRARLVYAISLGLLGALLIAPTTTEFASKVALLGSLAIVCLALPVLRALPRPGVTPRLVYAVPVALALYAGGLVLVTSSAPSNAAVAQTAARELPPIQILASRGVQSQLDPVTARIVATVLIRSVPTAAGPIRIWLVPGTDQGPPLAVATLAGKTYRLHQVAGGRWAIGTDTQPAVEVAPSGPVLKGYRLQDIASSVGLDFRQGSFRYGVTNDPPAMMGGGLCWLDYNNDGWLDLFVVNSYGEGDIGAYGAHGGLPRTALFRNDHGRFVNVTAASGAGRAVRGEGCVAADFNGDGYTDLFVTTAQDDELLWNNGDGTFTEGARSHGIVSFGWHSGAAVADVNGDGRPDLYVAGYTEPNGADPRFDSGLPDESSRRARPPVPQRGKRPGRPRALPRSRAAGGHRPAAVRPLARRRLHRRERRPPAGYLRRERRRPEPPLPERAGRPARVPLRRGRQGSRRGRRERRHGNRRRRKLALRQQLARPDARVVPQGRPRPFCARRREASEERDRRLGRGLDRPAELGPARSRGREWNDPDHQSGEGRAAAFRSSYRAAAASSTPVSTGACG